VICTLNQNGGRIVKTGLRSRETQRGQAATKKEKQKRTARLSSPKSQRRGSTELAEVKDAKNPQSKP
jgi:hypothetical protein